MADFTISRSISEDRIRDLIITGIESGPYGSVYVDGYDCPKNHPKQPDTGWPSPDYPGYAYWPFIEGCAALLVDKYEYDDTDEMMGDVGKLKRYRLDRAAIQKGLDVMARKYPRHMNNFLNKNEDAITGDIFIQCCCFGEAIYG